MLGIKNKAVASAEDVQAANAAVALSVATRVAAAGPSSPATGARGSLQ